jgi:atypical dual specificity phosphatase
MSVRRQVGGLPAALVALCVAGSAGCYLGPDEFVPGASDEPPEIAAMSGFSWVVPERLAAMPRPGITRVLDDDLAFLADSQLDLLISLTPNPIPPEIVSEYGIEPLHIPVPDFTAPTMDQLSLFIDEALPRMAAGGRVGVHCTAGRGRTGTFMAAYFVSQGMSPEDAIAEIRQLRPGSIETDEQERSIFAFYDLLMSRAPSSPDEPHDRPLTVE